MRHRVVISKRVESAKLYSIFSKIKARNKVGGSTWHQNLATKSMDDDKPDKDRHESHQKEDTEIWTSLVANEPKHTNNSGVKMSTNRLNIETVNLPKVEGSMEGYKGTTKPEQPVNNFQLIATLKLVLTRATEEDLGQTSTKRETKRS